MATPLGHSIVGYALARAAGVRHPAALGVSIAAACLPDVDFLLGYVTQGDLLSLHHEVITHKPVFPLLVGAATGAVASGVALLRGRKPRARDVLPPAALATRPVASATGGSMSRARGLRPRSSEIPAAASPTPAPTSAGNTGLCVMTSWWRENRSPCVT